MKTTATCLGPAALAIALMLPMSASAQVQTSTETQLAQRAAQYPHDISSLLDLARLYFDQRRFEEAAQTLSRAMAVIRQEQLVVVPAATTPKAAPPSGLDQMEPFRIGGDVKEPKRIKYVEPVYPPVALAAKVEGYVIIEALIGKDGHVQDMKVLKPNPVLQDAALAAARQWEYLPPLLNGTPVAVLMNVTVVFKIH